MKKHIAIISALAIVSAAFIVSCKKNNDATPRQVSATTNTLEQIKQLGGKYTPVSNNANRSWKQYAAADAIGGLEMAGWGGSVAGPWGALCGGITGGVWASCALDMFSMVAPNPDNPTMDGENPPVPGLTVGVLEPGIRHNNMLNQFLLNSSVYKSGSNVDLDLLKADCIAQVSSVYGFDQNMLVQIMNNSDYDRTVKYADDPSLFFESLGDNPVRHICETFYNEAWALDNQQDLRNYYEEFAEIIVGATDLTELEKVKIITFAGIGTGSLLYHNF